MNLNVLEEDKNYIISVLQDLNIGGDQIISVPRLITFLDLPCKIYTNRFKFQDKNLPIPAISVLFDETVEREFQKFFIIATDASKNDQITSIAGISKKSSFAYRINHYSSIFSAETLAICQALDDLVESNVNLLVLSDSLSVLSALQNFSIKSNKGQHLLDPYKQPITLSPDNQTCEFLHKILSLLDSWKGKNCTTGTITKETHLDFIHTTYALLEMSKYCINELKFQYFIPGKIQTDALESRFGKYKTLSGSQYLISIRQLYEVEAKLRMQNFLPLTLVSNTYGQLNLKDIHLEDSCDENPLESSVLHNFNIKLSEKDFHDAQPYLPVLT
ncbi:transposable element P transposase [Trichonephila clavipes]|nr:transposable element P transposase [Trichonephila clavipes]